jgi:hypothetical protein
VIFVFWGQPTLAVTLWIVILLLVVLGLIELIGSRTVNDGAGDAGAGAGAGDTGASAPS